LEIEPDKRESFFNENCGAYEQHSGLALVNVETTFDNLKQDPRYKDLLKRMNLPE
jgi:hypothetical protein